MVLYPPADPAAQLMQDPGVQPLAGSPFITLQGDAQVADTCGSCSEGHASDGLLHT